MAVAQSFRYEAKPRASEAGLSYASPDPAPQMMMPNDAFESRDALNSRDDSGYRYARANQNAPVDTYSRPNRNRADNYNSQQYENQHANHDHASHDHAGHVHPRPQSSNRPSTSVRHARNGYNERYAMRTTVGEPIPAGPMDPFEELPPGGPVETYQTGPQNQYTGDPGSGGMYSDEIYSESMDPNFQGGDFLDESCMACGGGGQGTYCNECGECFLKCFCQCVRRSALFSRCMWENFSIFSGKQGFKGPVDQGLNGDFGFHLGINWGSPIWDRFGIGFQAGGAVILSDFEGTSSPLGSKRSQAFGTVGLFRRANERGFQGGAAYDYLHDDFYIKMDLGQIRGELSYLYCGHELGFWGAFHTNTSQASVITLPGAEPTTSFTYQAQDQYNLFYRYNFKNGAVARSWMGMSGHGDGVFGGDAIVPFSQKWAVMTSYNYLLPKSDPDISSNTKESWNLTIALVWYPGYRPCGSYSNPYRPLFNVADNGWFMVRQAD